MTKDEAIKKLISIAKNEQGYLEKKSNTNLDDKTANAGGNNYTKYWRDVKLDFQGEPWCACFVSWCMMKAFGLANAKKLLKHWPFVYCPTMGNLFTLNANPQVGDVVLFKYSGVFGHTGIVTKVQGDKFWTIEGNTSGASGVVPNGGGVREKSYYNSNLPGTKFCRPDYGIVAELNKPTSPAAKKTVEEIAKEIIAGKWGNGDERIKKLKAAGYDAKEVQEVVNRLASGKKSVDEIAKEVLNGKWGNGEDRKKRLIAAGYDASAVQKKVNELCKH